MGSQIGPIRYKIQTKDDNQGSGLGRFSVGISPSLEIEGAECIEEPQLEEVHIENDVPWWNLFIDGTVNGNGVGAGIVLVIPEGHRLQTAIHFAFTDTNNDAEYKALIAGLKPALEMKVENINVFSDSMLVVWHVKGEIQAHGPRTDPYMRYAHELIGRSK